MSNYLSNLEITGFDPLPRFFLAFGEHRHTVEKYLAFKTPPQRRHFTKKLSAIAPYEDYILGRWEQGCRNATRIWREITEQGYPGAYQNVWRITRYLKEQERLKQPIPGRPPGISANHAAGILVKRPENRSEEEIRTLRRLKKVHRIMERCCILFDEQLMKPGVRFTNFFASQPLCCNGWNWGQHRLTKKHFPYEEGAKQHLIVRGPGVEAGPPLGHLVGTHDLAPTIADIAGAQPTHTVDGKSFKQLLPSTRPAATYWRKALLIENWNEYAKYNAVRQQRSFYAEHWKKGSLEREYYYLPKDPYQLRSSHASLTAKQKRKLHNLLMRLKNCSGDTCRAAEGS